jgi:hypothetical protein
VDGVLGIIFALGFLVLTPQPLGLYGIGVSAASVLMTRFRAGFLLAAGVTQFSARPHADSAASSDPYAIRIYIRKTNPIHPSRASNISGNRS